MRNFAKILSVVIQGRTILWAEGAFAQGPLEQGAPSTIEFRVFSISICAKHID